MSLPTIRTLSIGAAAIAAFGLQPAAANSVAVGGEQIGRLGIEVARPEPAAAVEIASVPAGIVIPPAQQAAVSSPVGGLVARLYVADGERVTAGQRIAEISSSEYMDLQREFLEAQAQDELARAQLARDEGLLADGIIALRRLEETRAVARAAGLRRTQTRRELEIAGLDNAAIAVLVDRRELSSTLELRAPFDGAVIAQHATVGDSIDPLDPIVRIANLSQLWVEAHVPQEVAVRLAPGMRMQSEVAATPFEATITTIGRVVDPMTQTILVRGTFDNAGRGLSAGQFLPVAIIASAGSGTTWSLPGSALTRTGDQTQIFIRDAQGFVLVAVEVVADDGERTYIRGDLTGSTLVAVDGVSALKSLWLAQQEGED